VFLETANNAATAHRNAGAEPFGVGLAIVEGARRRLPNRPQQRKQGGIGE
jgi:hypothetical protein